MNVDTAEVLERVMGIEPTLFAWEARVLPLNDTREDLILIAVLGAVPRLEWVQS